MINLLLFFFAITAAASNSTETILNFWSKQDDLFKVDQPQDVVLIIGDTGVGKTALTLLLTGAPLGSREDCKNCELYHIHDENNKIGENTLESKTNIPERMIDRELNISYYDCPGFQDSRSPYHDITTAYLINKLLKHSKSFKIVLVVTHAAVKKGETRSIFPDFLANVIGLFKNMDTYKNSIALVVTKVVNTYKLVEDKLVLVNDATVVRQVADYLEEVKIAKQHQISEHHDSSEQLNHDVEALKLLDVLLHKDTNFENGYDKVGIFRATDKAGLLNDMMLIQSEKRNIKKIITNNLQYAEKGVNAEFGLVISPKSRVHIHSLIHRIIGNELPHDISIICEEMKYHYRDVFMRSTDFIDLNRTFVDGLRVLSQIQSTEPLSFMRKLINATNGMSSHSVEKTRKHIEYMEFLLKVNFENFSTPLHFFQQIYDVETYIKSQYDIHTEKLALDVLNVTMLPAVETICSEIQKFYTEIEECFADAYMLRDKLSSSHAELAKVNIREPQSLIDAIQVLNITISIENLEKLELLINTMRYVPKKEEEYAAIMKSSEAKFKKTIQQLQEVNLWYAYLIGLHSNLSSLNHQQFERVRKVIPTIINACDTTDRVIEMGFEQLSEFIQDNDCLTSSLNNLRLSSKKKAVLRTVLFSLIQNPTISCSLDSLTVTGGIVRMSQIASDQTCWSKAKFIEIFASDSVIIDSSVEKPGIQVQMAIMSPVWVVIGTQTIALKGAKGKSKADAVDCTKSSQKGDDGEAGYPGMPGGNFLGVGEVFRNGRNLTILSEGGEGGPGQNGGKGSNGIGASDPQLVHNLNDELRPCFGLFSSTYNCLERFYKKYGYEYNSSSLPPYDGQEYARFWVRGEYGTNGGSGGDGGVGGYGGKAGRVEIIELNEKSGFNKVTHDGHPGTNGKGGQGGDSAVRSIILETKIFETVSTSPRNTPLTRVTTRTRKYTDPVDAMTETGAIGHDGWIAKNRLDANPVHNFNHASQLIKKFKNHLQTSLKNNFKESKIRKFLLQLENDEKIKDFFSLA